ncbi:Imidazolonepropionase [Aphelenchoides fujianensis]|nr:Imidazolonepropionase [Aphelenchoides fujianensis]
MLLFNLREVVQVVDRPGASFLAIMKSEKCELAVLIEDGKFAAIGTLKDLESQAGAHEKVDCKGGCLIPGLVDAHSHPVFAGDRVHEFAAKLAGATYAEVQQMGGGIHFTTEKTRAVPKSNSSPTFAE